MQDEMRTDPARIRTHPAAGFATAKSEQQRIKHKNFQKVGTNVSANKFYFVQLPFRLKLLEIGWKDARDLRGDVDSPFILYETSVIKYILTQNNNLIIDIIEK